MPTWRTILGQLTSLGGRRDAGAERSPQARLLDQVAWLESAEILEPGEVTDDELIGCAEGLDVFDNVDMWAVMWVLRALEGKRGTPFRRLAFFDDQSETTFDTPFEVVSEFARISGYQGPLRQLRLDMGDDCPAGTPNGQPPNAVIEFEMGAQRHSLPFVMYGKYSSRDLMMQLAPIFTPSGSTRRFYGGRFRKQPDIHPVITYANPEKVADLNAAIWRKPTFLRLN
ncbi:hypothetical protein ABQF34_20455 [Mycolicibacterium boenickei]